MSVGFGCCASVCVCVCICALRQTLANGHLRCCLPSMLALARSPGTCIGSVWCVCACVWSACDMCVHAYVLCMSVCAVCLCV